MKEKGMKLLGKVLFGALAAYGAAELLGSLVAWVLVQYYKTSSLNVGEAASIGVIGGADGPTAVFITTPASWNAKRFLTIMSSSIAI